MEPVTVSFDNNIIVSIEPGDRLDIPIPNLRPTSSIVNVKCISIPRNDFLTLDNVNLVIKISWAHKGWLNEADIIREARLLSQGSVLVNHLPDLIASRDVVGSDTDIISVGNGGLNIPPPPPKNATPYILRLLLFPKLVPLYEISEGLILKAWLDCFKCHFALWRTGLEHGDISAWNLMWDENNKCGILNDWDHACVRVGIMRNGKKETGIICERTGSITFMARDLLPRKFDHRGPLRREYWHEVESFIWTLTFICMHKWIMADSSLPPGSMQEKLSNEIKSWRTESPTTVRVIKDSFLLTIRNVTDEHPTCNDTWKKTLILLELLLYKDGIFRKGGDHNPEHLYDVALKITNGELSTKSKDVWTLALTPEHLR